MTIYKGWNAVIEKDGLTIGYVTNGDVNVDRTLEPYFEIQSRKVSRFVEGAPSITGKLSKIWIDTNLLNLLVGSGTLTSFDLKVKVGSMWVLLNDCKWAKGALQIPQDGWLEESYDFMAMGMTTGVGGGLKIGTWHFGKD